jgi:hypothetical protein
LHIGTAPIGDKQVVRLEDLVTALIGYIEKALLTEKGDIIYASAVATPAALAHGNAGDVLTSGGHGVDPSWQASSAAWDGDIADINLDGGTDIGADLSDADLILVDDGGVGTNRKAAVTRIPTYVESKSKLDDFQAPDNNTDLNSSITAHGLCPKLSNNSAEYLDGTGIWSTPPTASGMENPMIAAGDVIYGGVDGIPTRLAKGSAAQVLAMNVGATAPEWVAPGGWDGDIADIDLDGATDIGAALADEDLILVDDGAGGTNRKAALSRLKTYLGIGLALFTFIRTPIDLAMESATINNMMTTTVGTLIDLSLDSTTISNMMTTAVSAVSI